MSRKKPRLEPSLLKSLKPSELLPEAGEKKKKRKKEVSFFSPLFIIKWLVILLIWGSVFGGVMVLWYSYDLPDIKQLEASTRHPGITVLARDGTIIATYGDLYGKRVNFKELPPYVSQAIIATEDRRFYEHFGIDVIGILRAAWVNYRQGGVVQGGSTITQQLAKNFLLTEKLFSANDRSVRRKVQEILLALWLESTFTKEQIFSIYLNRVYLGAGVYGIEAAAQKYFSKPARELNLYEAAVLAGLLKAPSKYAPTTDPQAADKRARVVLANMVKEQYITQEEADSLSLSKKNMEMIQSEATLGRYFTDWVYESLGEFVSDRTQDLVIKTTLDIRLQRIAEKNLKEILAEKGEAFGVSQAALVSMTPEGAVRALVGGKDYKASQFSRATQAKRQAGSAFKLFVFLGALEKGYTPESTISDMAVHIGSWRPRNDHWQIKGELTLEEALAHSVNTAAVRLLAEVGVDTVATVAKRLGLLSPQPGDLTMALGSGDTSLLELTAAYAAVANHGFEVWPYAILEIRNNEDEILYQRTKQGTARVIEKDHVVYLLRMLMAVMAYGTGKRAALDRPCAGKTGTTQDYKDGWFVGFTPDLVAGTWMGNDDNRLMKRVAGGGLPAELWRRYMQQAHEGVPIKSFILQ